MYKNLLCHLMYHCVTNIYDISYYIIIRYKDQFVWIEKIYKAIIVHNVASNKWNTNVFIVINPTSNNKRLFLESLSFARSINFKLFLFSPFLNTIPSCFF